MASRTPPIPMGNPFQGSFQLEDNEEGLAATSATVLQYMAVKRGNTDEMVQPLVSTDCPNAETGFIIEGVIQRDSLEGEWSGVRFFGTTWAWA